MTNLTNKETAALKYLAGETQFEGDGWGNFTDAGPEDVAKVCGWHMNVTGGVLTSLSKKGYIEMGELEVYDPMPRTITEISVHESAESFAA